MARAFDDLDYSLRLSVLDRLIDNNVGAGEDPPMTPRQVLREIRNSVRRDLELLLNTRWRCKAWPPGLNELSQSVVDYGIPDFASFAANVADKPETLLEQIKSAIERFEPRLQSVQLELVNHEQMNRAFQFRVKAILSVEPIEEPILLESTMEPSTGDFRVERDSN